MIVAALALIIVVVVVVIFGVLFASSSAAAPLSKKLRPLPVHAEGFCQTRCSAANTFLMIPIDRDEHGLPQIELWLGNQPVRAVLDSASCSLLVAGKACRGCPAVQGRYAPRTPPGRSGVTTFGTQEDEWNAYADVVAVAGRCVKDVRDLLDGPGVDDVTMFLGECTFGVTRRRVPSAYALDMPMSSYNICGVGRCHGEQSFLGQLNAERTFTFVQTPQNQAYVLLREARLSSKAVRVPLQPDEDVYAVALASATLGGHAVDGMPDRVLFDTGSNYLFAPGSVCAALQAQRGETLQLTVSGVDGAGRAADVTLQLPASSYAPYSDHLYCAASHPDDDFLILGTLLLTEPVAIAFSPTALTIEPLS